MNQKRKPASKYAQIDSRRIFLDNPFTKALFLVWQILHVNGVSQLGASTRVPSQHVIVLRTALFLCGGHVSPDVAPSSLLRTDMAGGVKAPAPH